MCAIMGYCGGGSTTRAAFEAGFAKTKSRGPDESRMIQVADGWLGFHRLAIMGLTSAGMQPFAMDGSYVVCNGEIYGFERYRQELEQDGYRFASGSDCEILLPMYRKYGTKMFEMLDAEFACILYDGQSGTFLAARDPIGIRPLYYGYDAGHGILFASEPKNLVGLVERVMPFPPGYYYHNGEFVCYCDIAAVEQVSADPLETACSRIREKLTAAVEKRLVADAKVGFLLSGGLDSSLVCAIAARKSAAPIRTFAIGMEADAIDLKYARQVAQSIGSQHQEIYMTPQQVIDVLPEVIELLGTYDITTIRASIGMYLVCKAIHEQTDVRVLLTGEVSDELFGYKYTDYAPTPEAFQAEAQKRVRQLHMYDVLRADRCISVNSLEARVPFGDLDFVHYVMALEPEMKCNRYGKGKYLLRHAFEGGAYLPDEILWREKAAFSDAVGHSMVDDLKAYAEQQYSDAEFARRCSRYSHARPFTKESLLYREIFEQFYPGQSQMIEGFWMPNRDWAGCDVNDPSARVLANYGESGK